MANKRKKIDRKLFKIRTYQIPPHLTFARPRATRKETNNGDFQEFPQKVALKI